MLIQIYNLFNFNHYNEYIDIFAKIHSENRCGQLDEQRIINEISLTKSQ